MARDLDLNRKDYKPCGHPGKENIGENLWASTKKMEHGELQLTGNYRNYTCIMI